MAIVQTNKSEWLHDYNQYNCENDSTSSIYYGEKSLINSAMEEVENPQIVIGDKSRLKSWEKFNLNLNLINPQYQQSTLQKRESREPKVKLWS